MDQIILTPTTKQELITEITESILAGFSALMKESREEELNSKEWLTARDTERFLKISNVTRWNWTRGGILKSYKVGSRIRYRKDEVLNALMNIEARKNR